MAVRSIENYFKKNSQYNVELSAHTDAKGSFSYNDALSNRGANAAKNYQMSNGIPEDRIKLSTFGENFPIEKNELNDGVDTPTGRQFNRRVELMVYNPNGAVSSLVEEIDVPLALKQE